jgi:flagellar hook-associated protein 1
VTSGTTEVNRLLTGIADINAQIVRFEINQPSSAVDLRDQRQAKLEELAKLMPVEAREVGNGAVQVFGRDGTGADVLLVDGANVTGPVTFDGNALNGGNPPVVLAPVSGLLHGALTARDGAVQDLRSSLDQFAQQMVLAVNSAYNPSGTAGADFFAPTGLAAGSIQIQAGLTAATLRTGSSGAAGDNTLVLAVAAVASRTFSTGGGDLIDGTLGNFYAGSVSRIGQAVATAESRVRDQENIQELVRNQRDAVSGVSLDEEMADLVRFQRAFQASSRVFSIVDELLDTVVNGLGR